MFIPLEKFEIYKTRVNIPSYMIDQIYKVKEQDAGIAKTNSGGWHSKTFTPYKDYYNGRYQWTKEFIEELLVIINTKRFNTTFNRAWFNLSHTGGTNRWHDHGQHPIVGVVYVQVPESSSNIEFEEGGEYFQYTPSTGDFLIFPGKLQHRVLEHQSDIDRISFAINFN